MENMDFINWWFDKHYIWSTILTPAITLAWCCYKGIVGRGIIDFLLMGGTNYQINRKH